MPGVTRVIAVRAPFAVLPLFAVSARMMRRVLVDAARARGSAKRGGHAKRVDHSTSAALLPALVEDPWPPACQRVVERAQLGTDERKATKRSNGTDAQHPYRLSSRASQARASFQSRA